MWFEQVSIVRAYSYDSEFAEVNGLTYNIRYGRC